MGAGRKLKVLMVSSGQPSLNPRLVKEADALAGLGYDVTVLYAYWNEWGTEFDRELIPLKKWKAVRAGGDPENEKGLFFFTRLVHAFAKMINRFSKGRYLSRLAIARPAYFLSREARKYEADIYIGHNLAALPAVVKAAKAHQKLCGFDAEDFHRFETTDDPANEDVILKTAIENRYIPLLDYLTVSSPLIGDGYRQLFPSLSPLTILNVFPHDASVPQPAINTASPVRLLWFSQTIGPKRGIEDIIIALNLLPGLQFELHLLGNLSDRRKADFIDKLTIGNHLDIHFHAPVSPVRLSSFTSQFDIGLALEPGFSINNNSALSNKIFTYLQSGLCILASNTPAQEQFMAQYPQTGSVYPRENAQALADILLAYHLDRDRLLDARLAAFGLGRAELNWEREGEKFINLIKQTLAGK